MRQKLIIITAPSGAGKTSITKYLLEKFPQLAFSISATTRPLRSHEIEAKDYYFIALEEFKSYIKNHQFVEWEMVYDGRFYGTLKSELERIWGNNQCPVLDIDVKGAIKVQKLYEESLSIFIDPPSVAELKKRLESRGTETAETLQARVNKASYELSFKQHFNKIIVNDKFNLACDKASQIVKEYLES